MKFAVIKVINGNYFVHAEGFTDVTKAKAAYHGLCQALWSATDVISAAVMVVDENLSRVQDCYEVIYHTAETVSEPEE